MLEKSLGACFLCVGLLLAVPNGWTEENEDEELPGVVLGSYYGEQDPNEEPEVGIKQRGVVLHMAEDRKMQRVHGGRYEPEALDIYLKRHMDTLSGQIARLETQMTDMKEDLRLIREAVIQDEPKLVQAETIQVKKNKPTTLVS